MKFTSIIDCIKAIRALPTIIELADNAKGGKDVTARLNIGLKEAKDLTEAIMEYGKNSVISLEAHLKAENARLTNEVNDLNAKLGKIRDITYPDYQGNDYNDNDDVRF